MKPRMSYKRRMEAPDALWVIWSNKWCRWYRADSCGYTADIIQAGLYTREQALEHYEPHAPRRHRDTEPFPISVLATEARSLVAKARADLLTAEHRLAVICTHGEPTPATPS
ncbi:MAG: hypothetical protein JWR85_3607 [Marmoricola sp.]|nr:hypothetical protein [Marmoricola sp.]